MLVTLLLWLLLSFLFIETGRLAANRDDQPDLVISWLVGFMSVSLLAQALSILVPLGNIFVPALFISLVIYHIINRKKSDATVQVYRHWVRSAVQQPWYLQMLLLAGAVFILHKTSVVPHNFDSGLYHVQSIKWIEEYPVVPGLANFDIRQGLGSIWFISCAFAGFSFTGEEFHVLNGLLYLIGFMISFRSVKALVAGERSAHHWVGLLFAFSYFIFVKNLSSPSPDMPAVFFTWAAVYYFLKRKAEGNQGYVFLIVLLTSFAVLVKLSALAVMIIPLVLMVEKLREKDYACVKGSLLILLVAFAPWLTRNVITSGYLVFPAPFTGFIDTDWKVPAEEVKALDRTISAWARIPARPAQEVLNMPASQWIPAWLGAPQVMIYDKLFLVLFFIAVVIWAVTLLLKRNPTPGLHLVMPVMLAGLIMWFLKAPDFRFAYGFLLAAIVLGFLPLLQWLAGRINPGKPILYLIILLMAGSTYAYSRVYIKDDPITGFLLKPQPYPHVKPSAIAEVQNQNIHIIFDPNCHRWAAPLPCTCEPDILMKVQMRGQLLNQGFRNRTR